MADGVLDEQTNLTRQLLLISCVYVHRLHKMAKLKCRNIDTSVKTVETIKIEKCAPKYGIRFL